MGGILFLLGTWSGRRRAGLVVVAVVAAASVGLVLLAGLGARRASTGWERLRNETGGEDVLIDVSSIDSARRVAERVRTVDGVAGASAIAYAYVGPEGQSEYFEGGMVLPLEPGTLAELWRPKVTSGRAADPSRVDEVVVNELFSNSTGLSIGNGVTLADPIGLVSQPVTIVGVTVLPSDFTFAAGSAIAYPTPAFLSVWETQLRELSQVGGAELVGPSVIVAGGNGVAPVDLAGVLADALSEEGVVGISVSADTSTLVVEALELQRNGYLALGLVGGLAALSIFALMLARVTHLRPADASALVALGFTRRDIQLAALVPGGVLALATVAGAVVVAAAGQALVPTGVATQVAAGRSLGDDAGFLALAGAMSAVALAAAAVAVAWRSGRAEDAGLASGPGWSWLLAWPSLGVGLRAATGGLASAGRRQARAALAAVAIAAVGIAAVAVVVRSRDALRGDLSRVGKFYDVAAGFYPASADLASDREALVTSPSVTGVTTVEFFAAEVDGAATAAIAVSAQKGGTELRIGKGRIAVGDDELVASEAFLTRLHRSVGDTVEVSTDGGSRPFRVVGSVVLPLLSPTGLPGEQVALTTGGRDLVGAETGGFALGLRLADAGSLRALARERDTVDLCDTATLLPLLGIDAVTGDVSLCAPLSDIRVTNIEALGALPGGVIGSFAVLAGAGLAYLLSASFRRSRRDISVLRVLGFSRRQSMTTVIVHAGSVGLGGSVLALPLGIALGRVAWRSVAEGAGVAVVPEVSVLGTLGLVGGAVAVALLLGLPFAVRSVAGPPSTWLRAE